MSADYTVQLSRRVGQKKIAHRTVLRNQAPPTISATKIEKNIILRIENYDNLL